MTLSRRKFLINSGALAAAAVLPAPFLFESVAKAQTTSSLPQVLVPGDPLFDKALDALFPLLRTQRRFRRLLPHAALVTNIDAQPVYGYTIRWRAVNTDGTPETYHRRFLRRPSMQLLKRQVTGTTPFLQPGQTALVTPLFIWPSSTYAEKFAGSGLSRAKLRKYVGRYPLADAFVHRNTGSVSLIKVDLAAVVYSNSIAGTGRLRSKAAAAYRNHRNAERDQAVSLLRRSTANGGGLDKSLLMKNIDFAMELHSDRARKVHKNYEMARVRFADKVRHLANISSMDHVQSVLRQVAALPKTTLA